MSDGSRNEKISEEDDISSFQMISHENNDSNIGHNPSITDLHKCNNELRPFDTDTENIHEYGVIYDENRQEIFKQDEADKNEDENRFDSSKDAIKAVTNHFRTSPILINRRSSPNSSSTGSGSVSMLGNSVEAQLRYQMADIHNNHQLGNDSVFAYLGEELSVHDREPYFNLRDQQPSNIFHEEVSYLRQNRPYMRRAVSLEWLSHNSDGNNTHPCMIALPTFSSDMDITDILAGINVDDWVIPYIVSYMKDHILEYFITLPKLFDIKDYVHHTHPHGNSFGNSSGNSSVADDSELYCDIFQTSFDDIVPASPKPTLTNTISTTTLTTTPDRTSRMDRDFYAGHSNQQSYGKGRQRSTSEARISETSHHNFLLSNSGFISTLPSKSGFHSHHHRPVPLRPNQILPPVHPTSANGSSYKIISSPSPPLGSLPIYPRARSTSPSLLSESPITSRSLGLLYCNRDPSWTPWDMRLIYVVDNYLFEVTNDGEDIIGYCPLSGASIIKQSCPISVSGGHYIDEPGNMASALHIKCLLSCHPLESTVLGNNSLDAINGPNLYRGHSNSSGYTTPGYSSSSTSSTNNRTKSFWLRPLLEEDMEVLEVVIRRACILAIEDVYVFAKGSEQETLLGRGRFNEVRKAKRRAAAMNTSFQLPVTQLPIHNLPNPSSMQSMAYENAVSQSQPQYIVPGNNQSNHQGNDNLGIPKGVGIAMMYSPTKPIDISNTHSSNSGNTPNAPVSSPSPPLPISNTNTSSDGYIALKIVSKEIFRDRVAKSKERADSLVREVISQAAVCLYIANITNRIRSIDSKASLLSNGSYGIPVVTSTTTTTNKHNSPSPGHLTPPPGQQSPGSYTTNIVQQYSNPYIPIVQIFGVFETLDGFAMELELMQQRDLYEVLSHDGIFPEDQVQSIMKQLVTAVMYCMKSGIIHRDIKPSNITVCLNDNEPSITTTSMGYGVSGNGMSGITISRTQSPIPSTLTPPLPLRPSNLRIKLADFGMAGFISSRDKKVRGRCGTPGYVAPDILRAGVNEGYGTNIDMFSVGVVAYILLCGYEPFYGTDDQHLIISNRNVEYAFHEPEWNKISDEAKDWIAKALNPYCETRLRPEDALRHPWLQMQSGPSTAVHSTTHSAIHSTVPTSPPSLASSLTGQNTMAQNTTTQNIMTQNTTTQNKENLNQRQSMGKNSYVTSSRGHADLITSINHMNKPNSNLSPNSNCDIS